MMKRICLPNAMWEYDPNQLLGPKGGFGIVYAGYSQEFGDLAIKQIFVEAQDAAHRELRIANEIKGNKFEHVIPFYDAGLDTETGINFVVMARAEKSLQQEINARKTFNEPESVEILLQIVKGLLEVPELVHRDLKPGNVLFHQGMWKIADFGIAKFFEESTSLQTLNDCLTPQYAAPEQWEYQHPTHAVDVYALGCIGYVLLTGHPPFSGNKEDLKQQHLRSEPPTLTSVNARLRSLLSMMLRKMPQTRPSLERVKDLLKQMQNTGGQPTSGGFSALSSAAAEILDQSAKEEAQQLIEHTNQLEREKIADEAIKILVNIIDILYEKISAYAPNVQGSLALSKKPGHFYYPDRIISLGSATLSINLSRFAKVAKNAFIRSKWNVYAGAIIEVKQGTGNLYVWGANLWFTNLGKYTELRWWEVTYMTHPLMRHHQQFEPFAVNDPELADKAAGPGMAEIQFGASPKLVDDEAVDEFCDRWASLLAKAAKGELHHPSSIPLD